MTKAPSFDEARMMLARLHVDEARLAREVLLHATRISGRTLQVARVSVWFFDDNQQRLRCSLFYTTDSDRHDEGTEIAELTAPSYFEALRQTRVLAADDALNDERTRGLATEYLIPRNVGAMLDAPLYRSGVIIGVVCHEHVGAQRTWTREEVDFAGSVADIVSMLYLERQLVEVEALVSSLAAARQDASRLASLTELTRAFAHDVGNALTISALAGNRLSGSDDAELRRMGTELQSTSAFAGRLLRELRDFGCRRESVPAPIGEILTTFRPVLEALLRGRARLELLVDAPLAVCVAPRAQVEQIVLNLCLNARDASEELSRVNVRARLDEGERHLVLEVADHGAGIHPAVLEHVFEPYVTTKPEGSGLGLGIVKSLCETYGGEVTIQSELGRGTVVVVALPVV